MNRADSRAGEPVRVARVISRLNVGGPAIQAITLTKLLDERGYETLLLRGREGAREGSMDDLARTLGVVPTMVEGMGREIGPADGPALARLTRRLWRFRPDIVHTHAAKAGTLGRVAARLLGPRRPRAVVHTFHGHSLSGYWSSRRNRVLRRVETWLARRSDVLVAVSEEVRDELVALGIAPPERFVVIPLGFDLSPFLVDGDERARRRGAVRAGWGVGADEQVVTLVARLAPIKRVDRFLRVAERLADRAGVRFVVVGDGELHDELVASPAARAIGDRLVWAGLRTDIPDVCLASDVVVLTSDNEGTPVSLIEAQAAAVPVVATRVGGTATVVLDGRTGHLVSTDDDAGFAAKVTQLLDDPEAARAMGARGREHALASFSLDRLVDDVDRLYRGLLAGRSSPSAAA